MLKKNPREVAQMLVEALQSCPKCKELLSRVEIAGPGFINLCFNQCCKFGVVADVLTKGADFGGDFDSCAGKSVLLEYVSANPTGPLHLGHARQGALGDVLSRIMVTQGYEEVLREFYYNDAGVQIHNLAVSVQARAKEAAGLQGAMPSPKTVITATTSLILPVTMQPRRLSSRPPVKQLKAPAISMTWKPSASMPLPTCVTNRTQTSSSWVSHSTTFILKVPCIPMAESNVLSRL